MKKNFLFKGVSVLGAMLLLATSVMPGLQYACAQEAPSATLEWDYIYDEASWNAAYSKDNSVLKAYLDANWKEDRWSNTYNRACNSTDWDNPDNPTKFKDDAGCVPSWEGAINNPGAKYPWAVVNLPEVYIGNIEFAYNGENPVNPRGGAVTKSKYGIASIPTELGEEFLLDENGHTTFDPTLLTVTLKPTDNEYSEAVASTDWTVVYDSDSFNAAIADGGFLESYYKTNSTEDLWNPDTSDVCTTENKTYSVSFCTDPADSSTCTDKVFKWSGSSEWWPTGWGEEYQVLTNRDDETEKYFIEISPYAPNNMDNAIGKNTMYELSTYFKSSAAKRICKVPEGVDGAKFPIGWGWEDAGWDCNYIFPLEKIDETCPAVPSGARDVGYTDEPGCRYAANGEYNVESAGKYIKFNDGAYPISCTQDWQATNKSKYPLVVVDLPENFAGKVKVEYEGKTTPVEVYTEYKVDKTYALIYLPGVSGDDGYEGRNEFNLTDGAEKGSFDPTKLSVSFVRELEMTENTVLEAAYTEKECAAGEHQILGGTACEASVACIMAGDEPAETDTCFASLREAIASDASDGKTVYLVADDNVSFDADDADNLMLTINKEVTIDGSDGENDHYVKGVSNGYDGWHVTVIRGEGDVTIKNLTFKNFGDELGHDTNGTTTPIYVHRTYGGTLTLENVNIESFNSRGIVIGNGSFVINGGSIIGSSDQAYQQAIESYVSTTDNTISGLEITGVKNSDDDAYGVMHAGNGTVTVTDTTISGDGCTAISSPTTLWAEALGYDKSNGKLILGKDNVFNCTTALSISPMGDPAQQSSSSTIEVKDGEYNGAIEKSDHESVSSAKFQISGGTFSVKPDAAYIVSGKYAKSISGGKWQVTTKSTSSSSGGGGGSSSYSCKNLPDNATANNSTKPTKNTDYSYSTDTTKVCTFQCKSGYVWNEKDAKCEKSDASDTTKTEEDKTDGNVNTNEGSNNDGSNGNGATASAEEFSQEFIDAYNFAHKNGITTKESIEDADMYGPLTRIAMAKMLSQYAINVLGKTPDTSKVVPNFPDVDAQLDADYNNGVTLAYQLGIMGIGIEEFRPFDEVTRAEFGTALSRMLFGTADGEGNEWYKTHLDKLVLEKIITNDDPNLKELRGYVMIMLMRSASDK